jgi:hypothetical protein
MFLFFKLSNYLIYGGGFDSIVREGSVINKKNAGTT